MVAVAAATLVVGVVLGLGAGLVLGLWAGRESVTQTRVADLRGSRPEGSMSLPEAAPSRDAPAPLLELEVFKDGCGVIRSEPPAGAAYRNLAWVFRDGDGFQVLSRAAEGETRYRYFRSGQCSVVLEAVVGGAYRPVSNEVTVRC